MESLRSGGGHGEECYTEDRGVGTENHGGNMEWKDVIGVATLGENTEKILHRGPRSGHREPRRKYGIGGRFGVAVLGENTEGELHNLDTACRRSFRRLR